VVGVKLVHLAVDNLLNDVLGLALDLFSGDFALLGDQIGRDFVAAEVARVGGGDVQRDVLDERLEVSLRATKSVSQFTSMSTPMRPAMWM
jgi:hypothetical protein